MPRATTNVAAVTKTAPTWRGCGTPARFPTTARSRRRRTPSSRLTIYGFIVRRRKIPDDWFARQFASRGSRRRRHRLRCPTASPRCEPGPSSPIGRVAADPSIGRSVARQVEDRLSDALHERLTERFVDRRTSVLMRRLERECDARSRNHRSRRRVWSKVSMSELCKDFRFTADPGAAGEAAKALNAAAQKALAERDRRPRDPYLRRRGRRLRARQRR